MWSINRHSNSSTVLGNWNVRMTFDSEVSFFTTLLALFVGVLQWIGAAFKELYKISKEVIN
jgi:hypothetical protein